MQISFFLPMKPPTVTHQEKAVHVVKGKPVHYEPDKLKAARSKLMAYLGQHAPIVPLCGPLRLVTKWCFPITGKRKDGQWKTTRPDTDNLQKLLKDCMTRVGFWEDDAQVAREVIEKRWSDEPCGIYIEIEPLTEVST